jgi:chromosome segregation ATPase
MRNPVCRSCYLEGKTEPEPEPDDRITELESEIKDIEFEIAELEGELRSKIRELDSLRAGNLPKKPEPADTQTKNKLYAWTYGDPIKA